MTWFKLDLCLMTNKVDPRKKPLACNKEVGS